MLLVLNIEKYHKDFCTCKDNDICYVCVAAKIYDGASYQLFKNCLDLDFLTKFKGRLYGIICFLQEQNSHFVSCILEKEFFTNRNAPLLEIMSKYVCGQLIKSGKNTK